jgi:hypothetical protein
MSKKILFLVATVVCIGVSLYASDRDEITLVDSGGNAVAYIDTADRDFTIYLWNGSPVAYIAGNNVYGFNGNHLGWYRDGIIRDSNGYAVGASKSAFSGVTRVEPVKGVKRVKSVQSVRRVAPVTPVFKNSWSRNDLQSFLLSGARR